MSEIPLIKVLPKECPWCHEIPKVCKDPLWRKGGGGYPGCYEYSVVCENPKCKVHPRTYAYNDIYSMKEEDCINRAISDWNDR